MKTVKVRIAVVTDSKGHWHACGGDGMSDGESAEIATGGVDPAYFQRITFVTAEVPIALTEEVEGTVEPSIEDLEYSMTTTVCHRQGKIYCVACGQTLNANLPEVCSNCGRRIVS